MGPRLPEGSNLASSLRRLALFTVTSFSVIAAIIVWRGLYLLDVMDITQKTERLFLLSERQEELLNDLLVIFRDNGHTDHEEIVTKAGRLGVVSQRLRREFAAVDDPALVPLREFYGSGPTSVHGRLRALTAEVTPARKHPDARSDRMSRDIISVLSGVSQLREDLARVIFNQTRRYRQASLVTSIVLVGLLGAVLFIVVFPLLRRAQNEGKRLVEAQAREEEARRHAEKADLTKTRFLAAISHDIRSPLNVVLGYASILKQGTRLSPTELKYIGSIERNAANILEFVSQLVQVSQNDISPIRLSLAPFPPRELVAKLHSDLSLLADRGGCTLIFENVDTLPAQIVSDASKFGRVLENLIGNAIKFSCGSNVTVRFSFSDTRLNVDIIDTGPGIPPAMREMIFKPFAAFDTKSRPHQSGFGLGLAISRELARAMGGDITITSSSEQGSTFRFWIPLTRADVPAGSITPPRSNRGLAVPS